RRAAPSVRSDSRVGAPASRGQAGPAAAGCARARRRRHAPDRREAAHRAYRTAEGAAGRRDAGGLHGSDQSALQAPAGRGRPQAPMTLRIGTRGSELALYQANAVAAQLRAKASVDCEIVVIKTSGDKLAEATVTQIGGRRRVVTEIEDALLAGAVDIAVHTSKDMPVMLPDGLAIAGVLPREDARDA